MGKVLKRPISYFRNFYEYFNYLEEDFGNDENEKNFVLNNTTMLNKIFNLTHAFLDLHTYKRCCMEETNPGEIVRRGLSGAGCPTCLGDVQGV